MSVTGSLGFTPKSMLPSNRVTASDTAMPSGRSDSGEHHAMPHYAAQNFRQRRAQRHADADFARGVGHFISQQSVQPDGGQQQEQSSRRTEV